MAKYKTRRARKSRKGGNLFDCFKNPFGSKPDEAPPKDTSFSQENPMVAKQQALQLLKSVGNKIKKIPLKVVATTNTDWTDENAGWEQRAQAELDAKVTAFVNTTFNLIQKNPQTALATLE
jgi:hypothetical protein